MHKKIISIDFDGVLNNYNGRYDANNLPLIKRGAVNFLKKYPKIISLIFLPHATQFR